MRGYALSKRVVFQAKFIKKEPMVLYEDGQVTPLWVTKKSAKESHGGGGEVLRETHWASVTLLLN